MPTDFDPVGFGSTVAFAALVGWYIGYWSNQNPNSAPVEPMSEKTGAMTGAFVGLAVATWAHYDIAKNAY